MSWHLIQYKGAFDKFMAECTPAMTDAMRPRLARLWLKGNQAGYPATSPLGDGLFELRARYKRIRMRLLFGFLPGRRIVFVLGTTKDKRRLAPSTLRTARALLSEAVATQERLNVIKLN